MDYHLKALIAVLIFSAVHFFARQTKRLEVLSKGQFLSFGGGVAIAYVFIDLLPKLGESEHTLHHYLHSIFPYFEKHVYIMALMGFLLFFAIDRSHSHVGKKTHYWLSLASYALFNFLVGYAVVDKDNPEVRPLVFFTIAMALHYFTNDYNLIESHGKLYDQCSRWLLITALCLGWFMGLWITLPTAAVALISAFIGGGVIMNVIRNELPKNSLHSLAAFLSAAVFYTILLLTIR